MEKLWKKMSLAMVLLFSLMIFAPYTALAEDAPASGKPTLTQDADGNYTVSSVDDLNKLRSDIDNGIDYSGQHVVLKQDIDAGSGNLSSFTTNNAFNGVFNGGFHTISNYTDAASGLFAVVGKGGIVENVGIDANVVITDGSKIIHSGNNVVGSFYGLIANDEVGTINRCFTSGVIENKDGGNPFEIAGVAGISDLLDVQGDWSEIKGYINNCYSSIDFKNSTEADGVHVSGICSYPGTDIEHSYFYGKFEGNPFGMSDPIMIDGQDSSTCAYNKDLVPGISVPKGNSKGYTTEEMKNKDNYTALGFDFNKTWMIDPSVNDGYPYLNPDNESKVPAKIPVDVKITAEDKIYVPGTGSVKTTDDSLKAQIADVSVVPESDGDADLISQYDVSAAYDGDAYFNAPTIGDVPLNINLKNIKISFKPNDDYEFVLGKVLDSTAKLTDSTPGKVFTKDEKDKQIENAKKAEDIVYKTLNFGQGAVPAFSWSGDKAAAPGQEGSIILNDYAWEVFSTARSGWTGMRAGYYDDWFKSIQDGLQKMKDAGITAQDVKMTEWEKLVMAISAVGYDPRDITYDGSNLIDIISNKKYVEASAQYFTPQYAVFALNSYNYIDSLPQDGNHIDKAYLDNLIKSWAEDVTSKTGADGSVVLGNSVGDMWLMQFQPIAAYYDPNAKDGDKYYDVKQAMDQAFTQFSNSQTYLGSFWGGYTGPDGSIDLNNAYTNAQVYMTLGMAKADIFDSKYIKNGKSIIDGALANFDLDKGTIVGGMSTYEPAQVCRGLDSLVRDYEGRNSIFDCTDVTDSTVPVNNDIEALPAADSITSSDKAQVDAAEVAYDALSVEKKASISQDAKDKLTAAERKVAPVQIIADSSLEGKTFKANETVDIPVEVKNTSGSDQNVSLITALYDNNGKLIKYVSPEKQTVTAGDSAALTNTIDIPAEGGYKLKTFIWDGLDDMNPLSDVITIPADSNK